MSNPVVTVGIPFYNNEGTLLNAIKSIFSQSFEDWELILVDDGSTDNGRNIAVSIDDPRVHVLPSDGQNKCLSARLNQIAQAARGEFIARMDADDLSYPQRLAKQLEFLNIHKDVDVVGTSMCIIDKQMRPSCKVTVPQTHDLIGKDKFRSVHIAHATVMARAEWFRRWPYDEKCFRTQDQELWMRSLPKSTFANIVEALYLCNEFAATSLSKYAKSSHTVAKSIMRYGPVEIGYPRSLYYALLRYSKVAVYTVSTIFGLRNRLVENRYNNLTQKDYAEAEDAVDIIKKTELPFRKT